MSGLKRMLEHAERPVIVVGQAISVLAALGAHVISLLSLSVSMEPAQEQRASRSTAIGELLDGITGPTTEDIARGRSHVAPDSIADEFMAFLTDVRRSNRDPEVENSYSIDRSADERSYDVCLAGYKVLWTECLPFSDFTFDEDTDQITGWSIDGIPLRASFTLLDEEPSFESDQSHVGSGIIAFVYHARSNDVTCLFGLGQTAVQADTVWEVRITDVNFLDEDFQEVTGTQASLPRFEFMDAQHWAVRVPAGTTIELLYEGFGFDGSEVDLDPKGSTYLFAP